MTLLAREYTESVASKPTHPMTARIMFCSFMIVREFSDCIDVVIDILMYVMLMYIIQSVVPIM